MRARPANGADSIGIYHALKKMADAFPDPKTGELLPRARKVVAHTPMGRYGDPEDSVTFAARNNPSCPKKPWWKFW